MSMTKGKQRKKNQVVRAKIKTYQVKNMFKLGLTF